MKKEEVRRLCIKIARLDSSIEIRVAQVIWTEPHTPMTEWKLVKTLDQDVSDDEVCQAEEELLNDIKYFQTCKRCNELNPDGWMHSKDMCQSCAEKHLGIVY